MTGSVLDLLSFRNIQERLQRLYIQVLRSGNKLRLGIFLCVCMCKINIKILVLGEVMKKMTIVKRKKGSVRREKDEQYLH